MKQQEMQIRPRNCGDRVFKKWELKKAFCFFFALPSLIISGSVVNWKRSRRWGALQHQWTDFSCSRAVLEGSWEFGFRGKNVVRAPSSSQAGILLERDRIQVRTRRMENANRGTKWCSLLLWIIYLLLLTEAKKAVKCPAGCTCSKDNALCENRKSIPHSFPPGVVSL